eukprot:2041043-Pyramimonas_sp.AAC.1
MYGARVHGVSSKRLGHIRSVIAKCAFGVSRGRSRTLEFQLCADPTLDPTYLANLLPPSPGCKLGVSSGCP